MPTGDQRAVRVLILEDDLDLRETLALILSSDTGFSVEVVADVESCLERLRASDENELALQFDVLLLDLVLRGGHLGTEVLREAATPGARLSLPPVVVCTGLSRNRVASFAPEIMASNVHVLLKPFDIDELTTALRVAARAADQPANTHEPRTAILRGRRRKGSSVCDTPSPVTSTKQLSSS
jgi:CheY-like chemotaxis protein